MSQHRFLRSRRVLIGVAALVVAIAAVTAYVIWPRGSDLDRAAALLPDDTLRVAWTDWAGVREETGLEPGAALLEEIERRDLGSASVLAHSAAPIEASLGVDPMAAEWEILGQGPHGMLLVLKVDEGTDLGDVAERYREGGFTAPEDEPLDGGVWEGGPDVLAGLPELGEPVLQHVAFLEDERLLVTSDDATFLERAMPTVREGDGLDLTDLSGKVDEPLTAVGFAGDHACRELAMTAADEGGQAVADRLIEDAGGISPLTGYLVAMQPDHRMSVVFGFEDENRARGNADARRALASGEDPGQLLSYPDLFRVEDSEADGDVVVLTLDEVAEDGFALTNLSQGPVLLAAC
jgi:hypothetical protein